MCAMPMRRTVIIFRLCVHRLCKLTADSGKTKIIVVKNI